MSDFVSEDELREIIERTAVVRDLATTHGWNLLVDRASKDVGARQERILSGTLVDLSEYKKHSGFVEGALFVLNLPDRMEKELTEARERHADGNEAA